MLLSKKKIILSADDYGISPGVNKAIYHLAKNNRISATSAMVCFEDWNIDLNQLIEIKNQIDIGLHFVLTNHTPVSKADSIKTLVDQKGNFLSFSDLTKNSFLNKIKIDDVKKELSSQFEYFTNSFGFEPDFIDGHHNIHQYPIIRKAMIELLTKKSSKNPIYVRNTFIPYIRIVKQNADLIKSFFISFVGNQFKKIIQENKISTNNAFSGVYNLKQSSHFSNKMIRFLESTQESNEIIMVHPGFPDEKLAQRDTFIKGRQQEFDFLMSNKFLNTCKDLKIFVGKFNHKKL